MFLKILVKLIGSLSGLLGFGMLCVDLFFLVGVFKAATWWMVPIAMFSFGIAAYLLYVAFLVWFRFSPLAVRHVCGALGFYALSLATNCLNPERLASTPWISFAWLGCLIAVYFGYKAASRWLSRRIFTENNCGMESR